MKIKIDQKMYDRLSDDITHITSSVYLRMNVNLSKSINGNRDHFHKEYRYPDNKNTDNKKAMTLRRSFDYYASLEGYNLDKEKEFIIIGTSDYYRFKAALDKVAVWFNGEETLFSIRKDKLTIVKHVDDVYVRGLSMNKTIIFRPAVVEFNNGSTAMGVNMSTEILNVNMTVDRFMSLKYNADTLNMFLSAQNMINYLGRPTYGTNLYEIDGETHTEKTKVSGRQIGGNR